ncbi:acyl carrier protein [Streptomyces rubradiris]|uniref:Actinorhodin polyketide synthase acyl carrier protein n=1 Tax=Streptomyces rubradiris TaxID=285531 RepID=A0ABQ3RI26_STRRR|nr:acyl carrier protein [Streptomyces rubradiris]GHH20979.1 actinorhodin polyketide synthase acyl carrier protein [Streptomyces rubradiris]GHI55470.1 actinorhodin polyketide synthase acyl carrier protein [Streptomyces rubradiris]
MSKDITIDDLRRIIARGLGVEGEDGLEGDLLDRSFEDLGLDSLAVMETAAVLQREFGIVIPDDELFDTDTPRALLDRARSVAASAG